MKHIAHVVAVRGGEGDGIGDHVVVDMQHHGQREPRAGPARVLIRFWMIVTDPPVIHG